MPGEVIDRPNPQAIASHIPDEVLSLSVKLQKMSLSDEDIRGLEEFRRASNYIAAGKFEEFCSRSITDSSSYDFLKRQRLS